MSHRFLLAWSPRTSVALIAKGSRGLQWAWAWPTSGTIVWSRPQKRP